MSNSNKPQSYKFLRNALIAVSISIATILLIVVFAKGVHITEKIQKFSVLESVSYFAIFFLVFIIDSLRTVLLSHFFGREVSVFTGGREFYTWIFFFLHYSFFSRRATFSNLPPFAFRVKKRECIRNNTYSVE